MAVCRFKFIRDEKIKFLSHLDILRMFERSIKRAELPVAFSKGFNPRPKIVFALPLSVGLTSESEYADIEFTEEIKNDVFIEKLNLNLPEGAFVLEAKGLKSRQNVMKIITNAEYEIKFIEEQENMMLEDLEERFNALLREKTILVQKRTKRGETEVNIRPWIHEMNLLPMNGYLMLKTLLSAGIENNLRADLLIKALSLNLNKKLRIINIHRKALYVKKDNKLYTPLDKKIINW